MGLHLPEAPPPDSEEEEDPEGAAALRSRASIPMDAGKAGRRLLGGVTHHFLSAYPLPVPPLRPRGAGEEDDGGRGAALPRRAAVGPRDLRRPVEGHGSAHAADPAERCRPASAPPGKRTLNAPHLHNGR